MGGIDGCILLLNELLVLVYTATLVTVRIYFFMPRGGATAYGSRVVCVSVCLSVRSIFYKTAQNQLLKTATLA